MPNADLPPSIENVRSDLVNSVMNGQSPPLLQKVIRSGPKRHELQHMRRAYSFEDFQYAVYYAYKKRPWRRHAFMFRHFPEARWKAGKTVAIRLLIGFVILIPFLF